ncbi:hypothetical protein BMS_1146 [Halobacteriovorax marinus SJ]|uniref:Uncharacterized protein n=1 Tax=Halobacteriovorax marinus (strain ATCC BAA-682 / DSM 15412 / SJ) TaxID=862908 RepID=E1WYH6_HALMS|nr:hypothetical protein BMS_1146 [Halobacteriovorax marinus SJ]
MTFIDEAISGSSPIMTNSVKPIPKAPMARENRLSAVLFFINSYCRDSNLPLLGIDIAPKWFDSTNIFEHWN